jgi:hypothetical protein
MKTITPIKIQAKSNEKIIEIAKRALNNAIINCSIVRLIYDTVECLVFPQDNINTIIHYVKVETLKNRLAELEAK